MHTSPAALERATPNIQPRVSEVPFTTSHPPHQSIPGTCAPSVGELRPVRVEGIDHRIHNLLDTPTNGQSIDHNFQTACVMHLWSSQIHVGLRRSPLRIPSSPEPSKRGEGEDDEEE